LVKTLGWHGVFFNDPAFNESLVVSKVIAEDGFKEVAVDVGEFFGGRHKI
jgi:hypothetical protein